MFSKRVMGWRRVGGREVRGEEGERRTRRPLAPPPRKPMEKKASFWRRGPRGRGVCRRWVRVERKEEEGEGSSSSR
jgi:hypothetical protein